MKQVILPVAKDKGQEGEDESVEDADDGKDVGPAYRTIAQRVLPCLLPAHVPDSLCIPAIWKYHAAQHQAECWTGKEGYRDRMGRGGWGERENRNLTIAGSSI